MRTLYGWLALAYSDAHVVYAAPATYMVPSVVPGTMGQQLVTGRVKRCINYRDGSICHHTTYESEPEPLWAVVIVASVTLGGAASHQQLITSCRQHLVVFAALAFELPRMLGLSQDALAWFAARWNLD